ncbi:hypothetical protein HYC85_019529 [Camellia sinensis]|uniref:Uncharacterized protein n=1 Tax=Camellia sinensis TaxID=4442 RepID=A0A7J7GN15_CAMSI|nr:hypothetical protein HYC85_019529 [Camellia sinensis]
MGQRPFDKNELGLMPFDVLDRNINGPKAVGYVHYEFHSCYQFDYTILKYPQIGFGSNSSSRARPVGKLASNPGPSTERVERAPGKRFEIDTQAELRHLLKGMGLVPACMVNTLGTLITLDRDLRMMYHHQRMLLQADSERGCISRNGSTSKRIVTSSSQPSSSGDISENRPIKLRLNCKSRLICDRNLLDLSGVF